MHSPSPQEKLDIRGLHATLKKNFDLDTYIGLIEAHSSTTIEDKLLPLGNEFVPSKLDLSNQQISSISRIISSNKLYQPPSIRLKEKGQDHSQTKQGNTEILEAMNAHQNLIDTCQAESSLWPLLDAYHVDNLLKKKFQNNPFMHLASVLRSYFSGHSSNPRYELPKSAWLALYQIIDLWEPPSERLSDKSLLKYIITTNLTAQTNLSFDYVLNFLAASECVANAALAHLDFCWESTDDSESDKAVILMMRHVALLFIDLPSVTLNNNTLPAKSRTESWTRIISLYPAKKRAQAEQYLLTKIGEEASKAVRKTPLKHKRIKLAHLARILPKPFEDETLAVDLYEELSVDIANTVVKESKPWDGSINDLWELVFTLSIQYHGPDFSSIDNFSPAIEASNIASGTSNINLFGNDFCGSLEATKLLTESLIIDGWIKAAGDTVCMLIIKHALQREPLNLATRAFIANFITSHSHNYVHDNILSCLCELNTSDDYATSVFIDQFKYNQLQSRPPLSHLFSNNASRDEVIFGIIHDLGGEPQWSKLSHTAQEMLVEADLDWANKSKHLGRFSDNNIYNSLAAAYIIPIEHEFKRVFGFLWDEPIRSSLITQKTRVSDKPLTLGKIIYPLKRLGEMPQTVRDAISSAGMNCDQVQKIAKRMDKVINMRNQAVHAEKFDGKKAVDLRLELFPNGILRDFLSALPG